jgi:hypothetical protein
MRRREVLTGIGALAAGAAGCASGAPGGDSPSDREADITLAQTASSAGPGSDQNPGGYPTTGREYFFGAYNTDSRLGITRPSDGCVEMRFVPTGGPDGGGHWRALPRPQTRPSADGDNVGWQSGTTVSPPGECMTMFLSYLMYLSPALLSEISAGRSSGDGRFWHHGNKVIDPAQWLADGSGPTGPRGGFRQVVKIRRDRDNAGDPVRWSLLSGGAGSEYFGGPDLREYGGIWTRVWHVLDSRTNSQRIYMKRPKDKAPLLAHQRTASVILGDRVSYASTGRGWHSLQNAIFGFAQDMVGGRESDDIYWALRDVSRANYWKA